MKLYFRQFSLRENSIYSWAFAVKGSGSGSGSGFFTDPDPGYPKRQDPDGFGSGRMFNTAGQVRTSVTIL